MSPLAVKLSAIWFRQSGQFEDCAVDYHATDADDQHGERPGGGCIRGLIWALLLEAAAVIAAIFLARLWHSFHV